MYYFWPAMKKIFSILKFCWEEKPLTFVLWLAVAARLIAIIFAKGWGMLDDHFLVVEVAQSWADGGDVSEWLPWTAGNEGPTGHSFFYAGLHYLFFSMLNFIGLENPQSRMFLVRLIHGAFSLITVYLGYKIAEKLSDKKTARVTGLLLAVLWFMPWFSVRNLVEVVATPFLMIGTWMILKDDEKSKLLKTFLLAGFIVGLAFSVRFQTIIYGGGIGLALLFQKKFREGIMFGVGYFAAVILIQGGIDFFIWHQPFAELTEYVRYNLDNAYNYITGGWYNYLLLLLGVLIPPVSIFLLIGFFVNWRRHLLVFLPTFLFLAFHSYFPNKQERFIFTIVPFMIILGIVGWNFISDKWSFWKNHSRLNAGIWIFFWILNFILLVPITTMYSKRARVEAMTYLSHYENISSIIIENTNETGVDIVPKFYSGQWPTVFEVTKSKPAGLLPDFSSDPNLEPRFVLFYRDDNLEARVDSLKKIIPGLISETVALPSFVDRVMHWLNPYNKNETIYIYKNTKFFR